MPRIRRVFPVARLTSGGNLNGNSFEKPRKDPDRKVVFLGVNLKDQWDRLDSATRTWLLENPGCHVLPPAISAKLNKETPGVMACDPHGRVVLSRDDRDFIREKAESAGKTVHVPVREYRFFDTTPLPVVMNAPAPRTRVAVPPDEFQ